MNDTWYKAQISKYGSEEAWRKAQSKYGKKSKKVGKGYFYQLKKSGDTYKLRGISSKGGKKSKSKIEPIE